MMRHRDQSDEEFDGIPNCISSGWALLVLPKITRPSEWYLLLQDGRGLWHTFGIPPASPFHRFGYEFLNFQWGNFASTSTHYIHWFRDEFLPDGTNVIRLKLRREGIELLCHIWQRHASWHARHSNVGIEIPF
jgi:hypothetical protein